MKRFILFCLLCWTSASFAQVSINKNGAQPDASSMLDVNASNAGVLIPRMSSAQRKAIANPATGLLVYDFDRQTIYLFDGQEWRPFALSKDNYVTPIEHAPDKLAFNSQFGTSVAIHGDYAVVGATGDTVNGVIQGAAYVYHRTETGWRQQAKLFASNGNGGDQFGASVDIYGDYIVVGAPYKEISNEQMRGRAYVFKRNGNTWTQMVGLQAADGKVGDQFGTSVALYNNILVVSAPYRDQGFENAGVVYPFALVNGSWLPRGVISAQESGENRFFGSAIDFWGNTLVAGSTATPTNGKSCGAVFTYQTNADASTWVYGVKLTPNDKQDWMHFGSSVCIENDRILVGAPGYDNGTMQNTGAVISFYKQNGVWSSNTSYTGEWASGETGRSVALDGSNMFIGDQQWNWQKGRVVVLKSYVHIISNPDPYMPSNFGKRVAAHNGRYIVSDGWGKVYFGVWE